MRPGKMIKGNSSDCSPIAIETLRIGQIVWEIEDVEAALRLIEEDDGILDTLRGRNRVWRRLGDCKAFRERHARDRAIEGRHAVGSEMENRLQPNVLGQR